MRSYILYMRRARRPLSIWGDALESAKYQKSDDRQARRQRRRQNCLDKSPVMRPCVRLCGRRHPCACRCLLMIGVTPNTDSTTQHGNKHALRLFKTLAVLLHCVTV